MAKHKIAVIPILSERIKQERNLNKLTQAELAGKIGVTDQTIRAYENGRFGVPKTSVHSLAAVFGCCPEYLTGETEKFTAEEYKQECETVSQLMSQAIMTQNRAKELWDITRHFFQEFLHYAVRDTYVRKDDGSIVPVVVIEDSQGRKYTFFSRHEAEVFLLSYYDDAAKLLRYRLLDYTDTETGTKPTPTP